MRWPGVPQHPAQEMKQASERLLKHPRMKTEGEQTQSRIPGRRSGYWLKLISTSSPGRKLVSEGTVMNTGTPHSRIFGSAS